jgi:hypothetical protein
MPTWSDDFSTCTVEDVLKTQADNRAWNKELRTRSAALVNSRLANEISWGDYIENRKIANEEAAECRRRADILQGHLPDYRRTA